VTEVFLYSNDTIMGDMSSVDQATGNPVGAHSHPVEPRHVLHFQHLLAANRPGDWELRER